MQGYEHEKKTGQRKKKTDPCMPFGDEPKPGRVTLCLPVKVVVMGEMEKKDQRGSKKTHMVKTWKMRQVVGIHNSNIRATVFTLTGWA